MPELGGIGVADILGLLDEKPQTAYIAPASGEDAKSMGGSVKELAFQYWPSEISDTREVGWEFRSVPGGSHPIAYWTQGGARVISFTAIFTTDLSHDYGLIDLLQLNVPADIYLDKKRNPDLRAAARWLRWYTYPLYDGEGIPTPPPKLLLVFPGTQMAFDGADDMNAVMTQCDITYLDFFPSGAPRRMEAQLSFTEIVQVDGKVTFVSRDVDAADSETRTPTDYTLEPVKELF